MDFSLRKAIGGALLVGGTAIGAGMLALPVVTGMGGFLPATVIYLICYLFSASTGLLLLEVCLWMPSDANIISMAYHLLGRPGKIAAWILYLFLFYFLTIAYVAGGGGFVSSLFGGPHFLGAIIFTAAFGTCVYLGTRVVDRINSLLMVGLGVSFCIFIVLGITKVDHSLLTRVQWVPAILALPVMFTSFSYQGVIPSLTTYMERHPKTIRFAILVGSSLPFLGYVLWEYLILGIIPAEALGTGTVIEPLGQVFPHSSIYLVGRFFSIFALTTSFLGVTLGLLDFLSDGLQIAKEGAKKVFLCALIYVPPVIIAALNPNIFTRALSYAGGVGCALLLGLLPILMVWVGRYRKHYPILQRQLPGGKPLLLALGAFVVFELAIEVIRELAV